MELSLIAAVCATVFIRIQEPGELLSWFPRFVSRITSNDAIKKVLNVCPKCQSFWWALIIGFDWFNIYSLFLQFSKIEGITGTLWINRTLICVYLFTCVLAVFNALVIEKLINYLDS